MSLLSLAVELAFVAVFVATFRTWLRRRDPLSRDVMFVFASLAGLFVVAAVRVLGVDPPAAITGAAFALLLAQPLLTLRLVARIRPVSRLLLAGGWVIWGATALALLVTPLRDLAVLALAGMIGFVGLNALAAAYLGREARLRVGSARARLAAAAAASMLLALAVGVSLIGSALARGSDIGSDTARVLGLVAALLYGAAFAPPAWARRIGAAMTSFGFTQHLLSGSSREQPADVWMRLADLARRTTGATVALAVVGDPPRVTAVSGDEHAKAAVAGFDPADVPHTLDEHRALNSDAGRLADVARQLAAPYGTVLRFDGAGDQGCLVLLRERPSIFAADDHDILLSLIGRARIFAERSEALRDEAALSERLSATVSALERASQAKSDFLASMSHELRTPLSAIIGFSALMREEPLSDGERSIPDEWITHVRRSGDHLLALINDVLDLTKIEAGRIELMRESIDLGAALAESVEGLRPLADRKRIELVLDSQPGSLNADRGRLRQIVYNLLSNAIKFTPDAGRVVVTCRWEGSEACIAVSDTGVGIAADDLEHIFEEFRQVGDLKSRQAGTGLGLALTLRLVEAHGGRITVSSEPGAGARFEVRLPDGQPAAPAATRPLIQAPREGGAAVVLVIEDDPAAVRLLRTYLEGDGHEVEVVPDGEAGIAAARRVLPDAIILDVLLPGIDGWEVLRRLKSDDALRDIPVMVVSVIDERHVAMNLGAADYFLKPVNPAALLERLGTYTFTTKVKERTVRVLVIDDDPAARELVQRALVPEGFVVHTAESGAEGLAIAERVVPDLVICDLVMPGMDGFEVVRRLVDSDLPDDVPIIILTGQEIGAGDRERLNGRVAAVVHKTADPRTDLARWLRRAVSASRRRRPRAGRAPAARPRSRRSAIARGAQPVKS